MSQSDKESSDVSGSSDPSDSSNQSDSDDSYSTEKSNSEQENSNQSSKEATKKDPSKQLESVKNDKIQNSNSNSTDNSSESDDDQSAESSQNKNAQSNLEEKIKSQSNSNTDSEDSENKPKSKNETNKNSETESGYPSDSDSDSKSKEDTNQKTKSDSESQDSDNETKLKASQNSDSKSDDQTSSESENKSEPKNEAKNPTIDYTSDEESEPELKKEVKQSSQSRDSSDSEEKPVNKESKPNQKNSSVKNQSAQQVKKRSDFESLYQASTDSEQDNNDNGKAPRERSATTTKIVQSEKDKKDKSKNTRKSALDEKAKQKKSVMEEKDSAKRTPKKNKKTDDKGKVEEKTTARKSKKSSLHTSNRRSKRQSRKKDGSDDDDEYEYEYSTDNNNARKQKRKSSARSTSQMSDEEIDEAIEREDAEIEAVYQFNTRKNVSKLCSYFNAEETPEGIAHVIRSTKGLNGEVIGDYLGKKENLKILSAYFMEVDMKCGYIEAMRRSLSGPMFLPGEGQIIDRILQEFANCYVQQNPGKYSNADELYVLSFALVMLNSDLHNRNVQNRMTVKDFIRNTRHLLSASDVTDKELTEMYNEIQSTPFSFTNHSNDFWWEVAPKIRGYLQKRSEHSFTKWTKKYFVLTNSCLYYFRDDNPANEGNPLGVIQLTEVEVNADKDPLTIKITAVNDEISYVKFKKIPKAVKGIKKISFKAPDRASASRWLHRIKKSAIMSNFLGEKMNENMDQKM